MKLTDFLKNQKETVFSMEILPPRKGQGVSSIYDTIDSLKEFNPAFIDVTYHREEYTFKKHPNGLLEKKSTKKRPGTVGICAAIKYKYDIEAVPHLICGGFSKEETENALIDLAFLGIDNVLALRGDPIKSERAFVAEPDGHAYSSDLIGQITDMNNGVYIDEELTNPNPSDFCIGVAGYPEKHFEAPNLKSDLKYLKQKIDMGADYIVTQMFFNNKHYFDFVDRCRAEGITVPIIPGLKTITTKSQLSVLPRYFHLEIPEDLSDAIEAATSKEAVKQVGIEWGVQQAKELMAANVPCLHYYTMGRAKTTKAICEQIF